MGVHNIYNSNKNIKILLIHIQYKKQTITMRTQRGGGVKCRAFL